MMTLLQGALWFAGLTLWSLALGLFFMGVDRILVARMQARIGPPLIQPLRDIRKLLCKQDMIPAGAVRWVYSAAPVAAFAGALTTLFYIPVLSNSLPSFLALRGDAILVLYLLLIPGLAMVMGGFASASPYAGIGAQREMVTMLSYEVPLATVMVTMAWRLSMAGVANPFSLDVMAANPVWTLVGPLGALGMICFLLVMLAVTPGELGRVPFDSPEAETELAGGILVEYSGRSLALFQLAIALKTVAMCGILSALFVPWHFGLPFVVAFMLKSAVFMFVAVTVPRAMMARFRISQVSAFYWKGLGSLGVLGLALVVLDALIRNGGTP